MSLQILVIEDDPSVSAVLRELLSIEGYEVALAADGLAGLLKVRMGDPDVALLDIMMPNVDGARVLAQLLEEGGGILPVPVIVMTGSIEAAEDARDLIGAENVFVKPFEIDELVERIKSVTRETL